MTTQIDIRDTLLHDVRDVMLRTFVNTEGGYLIPQEASDERPALVRVQVARSGYCIERRRRANQPWMPIVTASLAEFDPEAWAGWRSRFQMTA